MKRFVGFIILAMVVISSCTAQSATNEAQKLVGTWVTEDGGTFVFNADGTGTFSGVNNERRISSTGTIVWGVSLSGVLHIRQINPDPSRERAIWSLVFFLSPDGRRMIYDNTVYQKR